MHKNITAVIILISSHLVGFISSHLTAITGPPKMSILLEAKSMPALIIKPRLILVTHTDDLSWYKSSNKKGKMFVQNLNKIVRDQMLRHGKSRIALQTVF